ncbi:MAG: segregation/condensation protein A [Thermorudis peleae]|nr:segregation/condensation protein A [Thermorudis peleae]
MTAARNATAVDLSPWLHDVTLELPGFSGSLGELLDQARTGAIELAELPVTAVLAQCLAYCPQDQDAPELLADVTALAARLLAWKARALLPRPEKAAPEEEANFLLPAQLAAAAALQSCTVFLADRLAAEQRAYPRGGVLPALPAHPQPLETVLAPQSLVHALTRLAARRQPAQPLRLRPVPSLETMVTRLLTRLRMGVATFSALLGKQASRAEYVVGFLALLSLIRRGIVSVVQHERFGDIVVQLDQRVDDERANTA